MSPKAWRPTPVVLVMVLTGASTCPSGAADHSAIEPQDSLLVSGSNTPDVPPQASSARTALQGVDEFPEPQVDPTPMAIPSELLERENQQIGSSSERQSQSIRSAFSSGTSNGNWWFGGLMSLAAVLSLVVILAYAARKWLPGARKLNPAGLEILGKTHLSPKQSIALVKMGRQLVMIGITPERISSLATVTDPVEVATLLSEMSGSQKIAQENRFGALMERASTEFARNDEQELRLDERDPARYRRTRHQVQGLLGKVKSLTAGGILNAPIRKT